MVQTYEDVRRERVGSLHRRGRDTAWSTNLRAAFGQPFFLCRRASFFRKYQDRRESQSMKDFFNNQLYGFVILLIGSIGIFYAYNYYARPEITTPEEFRSAEAGSEVNIIVVVVSMDADAAGPGQVDRYDVELTNGKRQAQLAGVSLLLLRDDETKLTLGHEEDITWGAMLKVFGTKVDGRTVHAKDISVVSNYVQPPPETITYDTFPEAGYSPSATPEPEKMTSFDTNRGY